MNKFLSNKSMNDPLDILDDINKVRAPITIRTALQEHIAQESIPKLWWLAMVVSALLMIVAIFSIAKSKNVRVSPKGDLAESTLFFQSNQGLYD